jgi:hypothetical protein
VPKTRAELEQAYLFHNQAMVEALREALALVVALQTSNETLDTKVSEMNVVTNLMQTAVYHAHRMMVHRRLIESVH